MWKALIGRRRILLTAELLGPRPSNAMEQFRDYSSDAVKRSDPSWEGLDHKEKVGGTASPPGQVIRL